MENENKSEIIIYLSDDGIVQLDVRLENETVADPRSIEHFVQ